MREQGSGFLSTSVLQHQDGQSDGALYFEYGLRPKLTLGLKVDANMVDGQFGGGTAFVFAKRPVPTGDRAFKLSYSLGLGSTLGTDADRLVSTALSYGRGLTWGERFGWLAVDGTVEWSLGGRSDVYKLDTTVGFTLNDRFKVMMQVFTSQTDSDSSVTLAPSLIWQPRPKRPSFQVGLEAEEGELALRLGIWQDF